jgi:hypothetical protein
MKQETVYIRPGGHQLFSPTGYCNYRRGSFIQARSSVRVRSEIRRRGWREWAACQVKGLTCIHSSTTSTTPASLPESRVVFSRLPIIYAVSTTSSQCRSSFPSYA